MNFKPIYQTIKYSEHKEQEKYNIVLTKVVCKVYQILIKIIDDDTNQLQCYLIIVKYCLSTNVNFYAFFPS